MLIRKIPDLFVQLLPPKLAFSTWQALIENQGERSRPFSYEEGQLAAQ